MSTEIEVQPQTPLTALELRAQVNRIQEVMRSVMQEGQHFGKIPGAGDKPTLLKAGAEKLIMTFRLAPETEVEPLFLEGGIGYRVKVKLLTFDGRFVGSGVGECSSLEEKYKWRGAVCDEEFDETPIDQRRIKYSKKSDKVTKIKQVRTNPHDQANTILKMAKKRALVDATLTTLGASDIFTQDIEDMDPEMLRKDNSSSPQTSVRKEPPRKVETNGDLISEAQAKRLFALSHEYHVPLDSLKEYLKEHYGIDSSKQIKKPDYEAICKWVEDFAQGSSEEDREPGEEG